MNKLENFPYKNILVLGLAKSGEAAARLLHRSGCMVRINDYQEEGKNPLVQELRKEGLEVITGGHPLTVLSDIELVVKNPGIPYSNSIVKEAIKRKIPVITEVDLAGRMIKGSIIGITGSNGKTTTTTLIYKMIEQDHIPVEIAGNIGKTASLVASEADPEAVFVVELSSFQLMGIQIFRPHISVWLNLFEAHLDYHGTMDEYAKAKAKIFKNQTSDDYFVYNADDLSIRQFLLECKAKVIPFSTTSKQLEGAWVDDEWIYFRDERVIRLSQVVLVGKHNLENILAAIASSKLIGVNNESIVHVLETFGGVEHRLQFVKELNGRRFYNDSKATNILATSKALEAFEQPVILLAGGLDRGNSFDSLLPHLNYVKALVVFGQTSEKIKEIGKQKGITKIIKVDNVREAAVKAYEISEEGDIILLSPACASWDQYRTFEERGDMFMNAVHTLE
ncbi:UDP-N-acetylmuramoyl-L-alanine--D-glutamate ligase [Bacillaceae bacterium S4-13-56]